MLRKSRTIVIILAILLVSSCCVALPCVHTVRDGEGWTQSANNLRQIGLALQSYHSKFKRLPPAVHRDKDGRPLHSWRVLLLPELDYDFIYKQIRLDEPWNSPHNAPLLAEMPRCYDDWRSDDGEKGLTHYQVLVGPRTAFELPRLTFADFPDGLENTILVIEASEPVPWAQPLDVEYSPDQPLPGFGVGYGKAVKLWCYEITRRPGFIACFGDGKARFVPHSTPEPIIRGLITRNGGEPVRSSVFD
jgi:hypothetical protein